MTKIKEFFKHLFPWGYLAFAGLLVMTIALLILHYEENSWQYRTFFLATIIPLGIIFYIIRKQAKAK